MLQKIADPTNLADAWNRVRRKGGAAGVDGVSIEAFERDESRQLEIVRRQLLHGVYRPQPLSGLFIPKRNAGWRAIGVPTVRDRVAQRACLNVVVPRLEPEFEVSSYAYREGRWIYDAIHQIQRWRDAGARFVVEADVEKCFDSIDRDLLLQFFAQYVQEPEVLALMRSWTECGVQWIEPSSTQARRASEGVPTSHVGVPPLAELTGGLKPPVRAAVASHVVLPPLGIPQGNVVSPVLCNVFLDEFDEPLLAERFKLVRYADDFLILASTEKRARQALEAAEQALASLRLKLNQQKTRIVTFDQGFEYLGMAFLGDLALPTKQQERIRSDGTREIIFVPGYPDEPRTLRRGERPPAPPKAQPASPAGGSSVVVATQLPAVAPISGAGRRGARRKRGRPRKDRTKPWETSFLV